MSFGLAIPYNILHPTLVPRDLPVDLLEPTLLPEAVLHELDPGATLHLQRPGDFVEAIEPDDCSGPGV